MSNIVWPEKSWATASPESQGMSSKVVNAAAAFAAATGGSGCIIRNGYLIKEWGSPTARFDIKSCTKGSTGITTLGLLVKAGKINLDAKAQSYYPSIGSISQSIYRKAAPSSTEWLSQITVKQLASMTAGFDDGRPPTLKWKPGTHGCYSNDTANMLAELCTLAAREDLKPLFKREVMDPIGASTNDWEWRTNGFRLKTINGITSREFAAGITITSQALARIGYLYLRNGRWNGRQILTEDYIKTAIHTHEWNKPIEDELNSYAMYWFTNDQNVYKNIPADVYFAEGLGNSMVAVCPSLDIVIVRLGTGSSASNLGKYPSFSSYKLADFLQMIYDGVIKQPAKAISAIQWAPKSTIIRSAQNSDNWPMTWADDGNQYTAYGDGFGFAPFVPKKLGLGLAKITGGPTDYKGINIKSRTGEQTGDGAKSRKASGMLMVDGVLYMAARNAGNSQIAWSTDHGMTWKWANWKFMTSFGCPSFLNFGKNYEGARDEYVYLFSHDSESAYKAADRMVLARVPKTKITEMNAYQFFTKCDRNGVPIWVSDVRQRGAVLTNKGKCYRSGVTYNDGLGRYLMCTTIPDVDWWGLGIYEAPEPWGPWTKLFYTEHWDVRAGDASSFPTKWMSPDGKTMYLVFSGDDSFAVRKATVITKGE
ncbi:MAG: serine hydrolase [Armatimonadota bacterium]